MGKVLSFLLAIYVFIHIFRLEMYPMYMYAMFSKQESYKGLYHVYKVYYKDKQILFHQSDFRKYTVLMNTIGQYDDIINNDMLHPEAEAIDKFINRLRLDNTSIKSKLKGSFNYSKPDLNEDIGIWLGNRFNVNPDELRIDKESYSWDSPLPSYYHKKVIYGMDQ